VAKALPGQGDLFGGLPDDAVYEPPPATAPRTRMLPVDAPKPVDRPAAGFTFEPPVPFVLPAGGINVFYESNAVNGCLLHCVQLRETARQWLRIAHQKSADLDAIRSALAATFPGYGQGIADKHVYTYQWHDHAVGPGTPCGKNGASFRVVRKLALWVDRDCCLSPTMGHDQVIGRLVALARNQEIRPEWALAATTTEADLG
jgi:hypothetical protein